MRDYVLGKMPIIYGTLPKMENIPRILFNVLFQTYRKGQERRRLIIHKCPSVVLESPLNRAQYGGVNSGMVGCCVNVEMVIMYHCFPSFTNSFFGIPLKPDLHLHLTEIKKNCPNPSAVAEVKDSFCQ